MNLSSLHFYEAEIFFLQLNMEDLRSGLENKSNSKKSLILFSLLDFDIAKV